MTDPLPPVGDGHTQIPDDVRGRLIPTYIATLAELYEAEAENIASGTFGRQPALDELLDDGYLRELHRAMFNDVWRWAGRYRQHDVNIGGVDWQEVPGRLRQLVDDTMSGGISCSRKSAVEATPSALRSLGSSSSSRSKNDGATRTCRRGLTRWSGDAARPTDQLWSQPAGGNRPGAGRGQ